MRDIRIINKIFLLIVILYNTIIVEGMPQIPHVINLSKYTYQADNKNWSIGQDEKGTMYFGNDRGLLEFDGISWKLNSLPNNLTARSVAVKSHQLIFTGSYEEFGKWERVDSGELIYTSLSKDLDDASFLNDDFWKIWVTDDFVYFQSFSSIYRYNYNEVERIDFNRGILFLSQVKDDFYVQQIKGGIFKLEGKEMKLLGGEDLFRNTDVRVILPYDSNSLLIGTSTQGVYIYDGENFTVLNTELSSLMISRELNCGIVSAGGTYYLGTILDGIFEIDAEGNVLNHISSSSSLQNNTILALYEDNLKNVWVALDRGISYIKYMDNMSCYIDHWGNIGAIYDVILWGNNLFIGTNQGLYTIPESFLNKPDALSSMKLIEGTQGQVWKLRILDDQLFCCHNRGVLKISSNLNVSDDYFTGTGVYDIVSAELKGQNVYILSTYSSIRIINKSDRVAVKPFAENDPMYVSAVDFMNNIWMEHFNKGVFRAQPEDDFRSFKNIVYYGGSNDDGLPYKLSLFKANGRVFFLGNGKFYVYDDLKDQIVPMGILNNCFKSIDGLLKIIPIDDRFFWALTRNQLYKFEYDGYFASILENYNLGDSFSLVHGYENISVIDDNRQVICLDNGFLLYQTPDPSYIESSRELPSPYIEFIKSSSSKGEQIDFRLNEIKKIPFEYNSVNIGFTGNNLYASDRRFQYKLEPVQPEWSDALRINHVFFERLPKDDYIFSVRMVDSIGNVSDETEVSFRVLPPWYDSPLAYMVYLLLAVLIAYICWLLILRRYKNQYLQEIRAEEVQRLRDLTGELKIEVEKKNAEILTQTSFIINKNELIIKIKDLIDEFYSQHKTGLTTRFYTKINTLLNNNLNTDDDWKMFLIKFEQKHTTFFKELKMLYPDLTNNDLRLCACLKLNLETKEIASLMNLSIKAVENNRYRLRKKLGLDRTQNLNDFFVNF